MARYVRDPWTKKSKKGMKSLNTMAKVGGSIAKAAFSSSSSPKTRRRKTTQSTYYFPQNQSANQGNTTLGCVGVLVLALLFIFMIVNLFS